MWLVKRQTKANGLVLGGTPITYAMIEAETNFPARSLRRWMRVLRVECYVEISYLDYKKLKIRILKSKKFNYKQIPLALEQPARSGRSDSSLSANSGRSLRPEVADVPAKSGRFKQSGIRRSIDSKAEEEAAAATKIAFESLSSEPFGPLEFRQEWRAQYEGMNGGGFTDAMERTIQNCQARKIKIPGMFFTLKRAVERVEVANKFKSTPL
jgi:hypothetical protein